MEGQTKLDVDYDHSVTSENTVAIPPPVSGKFPEYKVSSMGKEYRDAEWLRQRYWSDGMTYSKMADECGVSVSTIQDWMNKHDIDRRSRGEAKRKSSHPWVGITSDDYMEIQHQHDGETYTAKVHRLCAVAWFGIDYGDTSIHVHHESGIGLDNREENLVPKDSSAHISDHVSQQWEGGREWDEPERHPEEGHFI